MALRVLIVDDELSLLLTLVANLELEGFVVSSAGGGEEALERLRSQPVDIVLTDIRMPGMTGVELVRHMKARYPHIPVVLMTGFAVDDQLDEAIGRGAFAVLPKPFDVGKARRVLDDAGRKAEVLVFVGGLAASATAIASGLTTTGVVARGAGNAEDVLKALKDAPIDVCVTDLGAPGANAASLARFQSEHPRLAHIGIAPTGEGTLTARADGRIFAFLQRPFRLKDLIKLIAKARARDVT